MEKRITHPEYGIGTIINVEKAEEGYWIIANFGEDGERKLLSFENPYDVKE